MTKNNTLSNLQMTFVLAVALGQRGTEMEHTGVSVDARTIARLAGYPRLTTYHRRLLRELTLTGWLARVKHFYGFRWHLTPHAWRHMAECCNPAREAVITFGEIPF